MSIFKETGGRRALRSDPSDVISKRILRNRADRDCVYINRKTVRPKRHLLHPSRYRFIMFQGSEKMAFDKLLGEQK